MHGTIKYYSRNAGKFTLELDRTQINHKKENSVVNCDNRSHVYTYTTITLGHT
jgi:hypothetical protein